MRMRIVVVSLLALAVGIGMVGVGKSGGGPEASSARAANPPPPPGAPPEMPHDRPGTINGAVNPELIADHVAFLVIFRMVADRKTAEEKSRIRPYIRRLLGIKCPSCGPPDESTGRTVEMDEADIDAVVAAAEEFHREVSVLDKKVEEIKWRSWPDPGASAMGQLKRLQAQKEAIALRCAASLRSRLTPASQENFNKEVNGHIKRRIKLTPGPQSEAEERTFELHAGPKP